MVSRILRIKDLTKLTGLSRSAIYDRMDAKSPRCDPDFPKSVALGGTAVGWFLEDVERWLATCASRPRQKPTAKQQAAPVRIKTRVQRNGRTAPLPADTAQLVTSARGRSLAEAIVAGTQLNEKLLAYLRIPAWSDTAAALLIAGVTPPEPDCTEVPEGGLGLEGKLLHASNARFHLARRVLRQWHRWDDEEGEDPNPVIVEPARFIAWCLEENIDTEWLRLLTDLLGMRNYVAADLTAAQLALIASSTKLD